MFFCQPDVEEDLIPNYPTYGVMIMLCGVVGIAVTSTVFPCLVMLLASAAIYLLGFFYTVYIGPKCHDNYLSNLYLSRNI